MSPMGYLIFGAIWLMCGGFAFGLQEEPKPEDVAAFFIIDLLLGPVALSITLGRMVREDLQKPPEPPDLV